MLRFIAWKRHVNNVNKWTHHKPLHNVETFVPVGHRGHFCEKLWGERALEYESDIVFALNWFLYAMHNDVAVLLRRAINISWDICDTLPNLYFHFYFELTNCINISGAFGQIRKIFEWNLTHSSHNLYSQTETN